MNAGKRVNEIKRDEDSLERLATEAVYLALKSSAMLARMSRMVSKKYPIDPELLIIMERASNDCYTVRDKLKSSIPEDTPRTPSI